MQTTSTPTKPTVGLGRRLIIRLVVIAMIASIFAVGAIAPNADAQRTQRGQQRTQQTQPPIRVEPAKTPRPVVSEASEIDLAVTNAKTSPTLIAVTSANELTRVAATNPNISSDFATDTLEMVQGSRLTAQPEFAHLFDSRLGHLFVVRPTYTEPIVVTQHQVLVDRTISYELAPGACASAANRRNLGDLCFDTEDNIKMPEEVAANVAEIRTELAKAKANQEIVPGVSVAEAQAMTDDDLLQLSLNSGPSSIRRLSTLPRSSSGSLMDLDDLQTFTETSAGLHQAGAAEIGGVAIDDSAVIDPYNFDTEYLLTGFTYSRHYGEKWEYEKDAWWHPRVYVSFSYDFSAGFGVRAPFSVDVNYVSGDTNQSTVAVSVDPVSLDVAASHVGLAEEDYFDGNEFVLEVNFDCELKASVAGWERSLECDDLYSIDTSISRDFDPVIGDEVRNVARMWLWEDGASPVRAEMFGGAVWGEVNLGVGLNVRDGRFGADIASSGTATLTGANTSGPTWFENRSAQLMTVTGSPNMTRLGSSGGMTIADPRYSFKAAISPRVKLTVGIDKYITKDWSYGFDLDFFEIGARFELGAHENTDTELDYNMFGSNVVVAVEDFDVAQNTGSNGGSQPAPPPQTGTSTGGLSRPGSAVVIPEVVNTRLDPAG